MKAFEEFTVPVKFTVPVNGLALQAAVKLVFGDAGLAMAAQAYQALDEAMFAGYLAGRSDGETDGYDEGYNDGHLEGYNYGRDVGYQDARDAIYSPRQPEVEPQMSADLDGYFPVEAYARAVEFLPAYQGDSGDERPSKSMSVR